MKAIIKGVIVKVERYENSGDIAKYTMLVQPSPYISDCGELLEHWHKNAITVTTELTAGLEKER